MAVTLLEARNLAQTELQRGVIETFIIESSFMEMVPFMGIEGNAYAYNEEATLPGVEFRAVNAGYSESTGTVNPKTEALTILGGDADVDEFIQLTMGNINDQRATQTRMKVKAAAYKFQDSFINGDVAVDANGFEGLKKRIVGSQVIDAGTNGLGPVAGGHDFFDRLDELVDLVGGANLLVMNRQVRGKVRSAARRTGSWDMVRDDFGRPIEFYNGIPIIDAGKRADGAPVIPQTETQGTSTAASSVYAVRFGENEADQAVTGLQHNSGLRVKDLGELQSKPALRTRIDWYVGMAMFGKGAARLRGVLNA